MRAAEDPGRLALSAYTYLHVPMVTGIVALAAADELAIAHPGEEVSTTTAAVILGGAAIYLAGATLFVRSIRGRVMRSRIVGIAALCALVPLGIAASTVVLLLSATVVLVAVAAWETWEGRGRPALSR